MFLKKIFFLGVILIALSSCYYPDSRDSFEDLKKLDGKWSSKEGVLFNEHWQVVNDSLMTGLGFSLKGTDTAFVEKMKIYLNGDSVYFAAKTDSKEGFVSFTLKEAGRKKWVFVNTAHDYPNIIQYEVKDDTLLSAFIANIRGNKKVEFNLKREK
jgi:hypothetical protein